VNEYILIADIARKHDYFALMLIHDKAGIVPGDERLGRPDRALHTYNIASIQQYQGMGYEEMAEHIHNAMENPRLKLNTDLLVDGTGVGDAVIELLRKHGEMPIPIIFTAGGAARPVYENWGDIFKGAPGELKPLNTLKEFHIPKKDMIDAGLLLLQQGRVTIAPGKWRNAFKSQLQHFRSFKTASGHVKMEADVDAIHDDLVVCYCMGAWWALNRKDRNDIKEERVEEDESAGWEPWDFM